MTHKVDLQKTSKILVGTLFVLLLLLPIIIQGNQYFVGGDDMRLYYLFPEAYLKNLAFNIISDNTIGGANTGYQPVTYLAPFYYTILFFKRVVPFVNTQYLMYGLNYAFGFLFFYLFLSIWIKTKNIYTFLAKFSASLFYVFSPFLIGTLYRNHLMIIYLISLYPAMMYLFSKAVLEKKYIYVIMAALIFSTFSTTLNSIPWALPLLITGVPYFLYLFVREKKSFLINAFILMVSFLFLNLHWIFHYINSNVNNSGIGGSLNYYSGDDFEAANTKGMLGVSRLLSPLVPILVKVDYSLKNNFSHVYLINTVFMAVIAAAGIFIARIKEKRITELYWLSLAGLLFSWFLFSPNMGNWGPAYFVKFAQAIPFGTMFRNMFDKFSLPLSFYYSFSIALSLIVLAKRVKSKRLINVVFAVTFIVMLVTSYPMTQKRGVLEGNAGTISGEFGEGFDELIYFLKDFENESRFLWFPVTAPNYVSVEDKNQPGNFYSGLSPLRVLAGKGDYAGRFSFLLPNDIYYGDRLIELLEEGRYVEYAKNLQRMNARYVIADKQDIPEGMKSYLYDVDRKYLDFQNDEYKKVVFGERIKDFGDTYTLYLINDDYLSDRIYLTDEFSEFPDTYEDLEYQKQSSYLFDVKAKNLDKIRGLVFMDPYYKDWTLYLIGENDKMPYKKGENVIVHDWANGWEIDPNEIKRRFGEEYYDSNTDGSINVSFQLYFEPEKYDSDLYAITASSFAVLILVIFIYFLSKIKKVRK
ncbi:hypothetical protein ACFL2C_00080 [Patescibacteria group bacterium]